MHRCVSLLLCLIISSLPCLSEPPQSAQRAGEITALIPSAERNSKPTKAKDAVDWNDLLKTEQTGRLRASLSDGSTLSLGSNTQMRVLQHDAKSQQTSIELGLGALRSRVVKLTNPGAKFEVHTPQAIIGVIGTDFYVGVTGNRTVVVCYSGTLSVTPNPSAQAANQSSGTQAAGGQNALTVPAGSMVEIAENVPPAVQPTPRSVQDATIASTDVEPPHVAVSPGHAVLHVIIGAAAAGAMAGTVVGTSGKGSSSGRGCIGVACNGSQRRP